MPPDLIAVAQHSDVHWYRQDALDAVNSRDLLVEQIKPFAVAGVSSTA